MNLNFLYLIKQFPASCRIAERIKMVGEDFPKKESSTKFDNCKTRFSNN
jgi:hypothetical protein